MNRQPLLCRSIAIGRAMGVTRAQAHHVISGRSATSMDRLFQWARALSYRETETIGGMGVPLCAPKKCIAALDDASSYA